MNYKRIYDNLVASCKNRTIIRSQKGYEIHHVVPKSLGGQDDEDNLVMFTLKEHFLAHKLLFKFKKGSDKYKMYCALLIMSGCGRYNTSKEYMSSKNINLCYYRYWNKQHYSGKALIFNCEYEFERLGSLKGVCYHDLNLVTDLYNAHIKHHNLYSKYTENKERLGMVTERRIKMHLLKFIVCINSVHSYGADSFILESNVKELSSLKSLVLDVLEDLSFIKETKVSAGSGVKSIYKIVYGKLPKTKYEHYLEPLSEFNKTFSLLLDEHDMFYVSKNKDKYRISPRVYQNTALDGNSVFEKYMFVYASQSGTVKHLKLLNEELDKILLHDRVPIKKKKKKRE